MPDPEDLTPDNDQLNLSGAPDDEFLSGGSDQDFVEPEVVDETSVPSEPTIGSVPPTYLADKLGLDSSRYEGKSEDDVYRDISDRLHRAAALEQEVQSLKPYAHLGYQQIYSQNVAPQPPQEPSGDQEKPWWAEKWSPPELNEHLVDQYLNPDGSFKENTPPEIQGQILQYQGYRSGAAKQFFDNPYNYIYEAIKTSPLVDEIREQVHQEMFYENVQSQSDRWVQDNSDWLFAQDGNGQVAVGLGGVPIPTEYGRRFNEYLGLAAQRGIMSPMDRIDFAKSYMIRDFNLQDSQRSAYETTPATPADSLADSNAAELKSRAATPSAQRRPSQTGTQASGSVDPESMEGKSLTEKLFARGREAGLVS